MESDLSGSDVEVNGAEDAGSSKGADAAKTFKNKHRVAEEKLKNKRNQKEALKKIKQKKK